jgi:short-subunit dehydrogenase
MRAMVERRRGHIAFVASVAGYRGLPKGAAYAPTKAALNSLAESLHADLKLKGVTLSVINPGFVATPMTAPNTFPMPYIVDEETAAAAIERGLRRGGFETVFPFQMAVMMKTMRLLPHRVYFWLIGKISAREPPPKSDV